MGLFSTEKRAVSNTAGIGWKALSDARSSGPADPMSLSAVFFCTNLIVESLCCAPIDVYQNKRTGKREAVRKPAWLAKPNARMTEREFFGQVFYSLISFGNSYTLVLRNRADEIDELYPVDPSLVDVTLSGDKLVYEIAGINEVFTDRDILHIKGLSAPGSLKGFSPLEAARRSVQGSVAAEEHAKDYFQNGSTMQGVLTVPAASTSGKDSDGIAQKAQKIKESFTHASRGSVIGVLYGGVSYESVSISNEQAQFLETRRFNKVDIAHFFRVPPHMVDPTVASSWGTGVTEMNQAFIQYTLQPWAITVETAFNRWMLRESEYMKFNLSASLRARESERMDVYTKGVMYGIYTINEIRALEDLPPVPGGDVTLVPTSNYSLDKAVAAVAGIEEET
jgi:HK97 family phage portal protein